MENKKDKITNEDINKIKGILEEKEIIEDSEMTNLKKLQIESGTDCVKLGKLFLICYDYLANNSYLLSEDENINKKLDDYLSDFNVVDLRILLERYGEGGIGTYFQKQKIQDMVNDNREKFNGLIQTFFKLFEEED